MWFKRRYSATGILGGGTELVNWNSASGHAGVAARNFQP